jgi:hypothetical protein
MRPGTCICCAILTALFAGSAACAGSAAVIASVGFDNPLTLIKNSDINFGTLKALTSGTYVIDTNGDVHSFNGGVISGGTTSYGKITITGSSTQTIAISAGSYAADRGVTPSAASCDYNGVVIAHCDAGSGALIAPADGKILKLGLTITVDGTQAAQTAANPTFVVSVVYH